MSSLKTLELAVDLATRRRDAGVQALAQAERVLAAGHDQMGQLENYARDTENRWTVRGQIATTPEIMRHHYQFMDRLNQAMELQKSVLRDRGALVEAARAELLQAEVRLASLKKVCEKRRAVLSREQNRREQREIDEMAAAQHRKHAATTNMGNF